MGEENNRVDIAQEVAIQMDALTTENSELKEKVRELEKELLNRNDEIRTAKAHLKAVLEERDYLRGELDKYELNKKEGDKEKLSKLSVGVGFIDLDEPMVSLEETLRAVKDAGCDMVSFTFIHDEGNEG